MEMLERGFKFRRQPLLFMITNSGTDRNSICWEEHEHAVKVAAGNAEAKDEDAAYVGDVIDDTTFSYVCALDQGDQPLDDPTCWPKANPLLGVTITEEYLAGVVAQAKAMPGKLNGILRLHFCTWTDAEAAWMTRSTLEPVLADFDPAIHHGKSIALGLDLSQTRDITAKAGIVQTGEVTVERLDDHGQPYTVVAPTYDAWIEAWTPGDTAAARALADKLDYPRWIREGFLQGPKGESIAFRHIAQSVAEDVHRFKVMGLGYDRYAYRAMFEPELNQLGVAVEQVEHPQGGTKKGKATKAMIEAARRAKVEPEGLWMPSSLRSLETLLFERRIRLRRNPVLVSAMMSAVLVIVGGGLYLAFGFFLRNLGEAGGLLRGVGWAISALIEPIGTLVAGARVLAMQFASTLGMAAVRASLAALVTPIGLVTVAVAALGYAWYSHEERLAAMNAEQERLRTTLGGAKPALDAAAEAIDSLAGKTGAAAAAARDHAVALLGEAKAAAMAAASTAQNDSAMARFQAAKANRDITIATGINLGSGGILAPATDIYSKARQQTADAYKKTADEAADAAKQAQARYDQLVGALNAPRPKAIAYTPPSDKKPKSDDGEKKDKHGLTAEDLRMQKEIEAAQLRGDLAEAQSLQDRLDLSKQIEAYQRTGLGVTDATTRANRDLKDIEAARLVSQSRAIADAQRSIAITIAERDQNYALEDSLERQASLEKLILFYKGEGKTQAQAEVLARKDQADQDSSQARVRERWFQDDADARALRIAQLRGDSDVEIAQQQRIIDVKKRADEIGRNSKGRISRDDALAQANAEADQDKKSELTGKFRGIFKDGFKAAMDGDIGSWFTTWWKDRVQKGMEQALNALSDLVARLFSKLSSGGGSGGGGLFGSLGSVVGSLFGKTSYAPSVDMSGWGAPVATSSAGIGSIAMPDLPRFATGGSFTVGGRSGIDQNLVAMHLSKGEMVDIRRPGNDTGPTGGVTVHAPVYFSGGVDLATRTEVYRVAGAVVDTAVAKVREQDRRRG